MHQPIGTPDQPDDSVRDLDVSGRRILVVDDEAITIRLLERILRRAGYTDVIATTDALAVPDMVPAWRPDLIILDLHMPELGGFALLEQIRAEIPPGEYLPILVVTGDASSEAKLRALQQGVSDLLSKPFDQAEALLRIRNLLMIRSLQQQVLAHNQELEGRVLERTADLEHARLETIDRLARATEYRDDATGEHTRRVGQLAGDLCLVLGWPAEQAEIMRRAAPLHDVGKIGVPDAVLLKPGRLTPEEFATIRTHTVIGARILSGSQVPVLQCAEEIAATHHERWDGTGYAGLRGDQIPLSGRIVALVDAFDALTHARPYKAAWSLEEALTEVRAQRGLQFDPMIVDAFLQAAQHLPIMP